MKSLILENLFIFLNLKLNIEIGIKKQYRHITMYICAKNFLHFSQQLSKFFFT